MIFFELGIGILAELAVIEKEFGGNDARCSSFHFWLFLGIALIDLLCLLAVGLLVHFGDNYKI